MFYEKPKQKQELRLKIQIVKLPII